MPFVLTSTMKGNTIIKTNKGTKITIQNFYMEKRSGKKTIKYANIYKNYYFIAIEGVHKVFWKVFWVIFTKQEEKDNSLFDSGSVWIKTRAL